jgi:Arc/MetJ family transcription regulator
MATNLDIDQSLLEKAVELSGKKSKKDAVTMALEEFIARRSQKGLLELFGKIDWDPGYDCKAERSRT